LGSGTQAGRCRTLLAGAVVGAKVFVAVHVEDRDDNKDDLIQPGSVFLCHGHVAYEHEHGILAFDFAGMNSALDQDDDLTAFCGGLRRESAILRYNQRDGRAAFRGIAYFENLDKARSPLQTPRYVNRLSIGSRFVPARLLPSCKKIFWCGCGTGRQSLSGLRSGWFDGRVRGNGVLRQHTHQQGDTDHLSMLAQDSAVRRDYML
jgi:hypothetical protein